MPEYLEKLIEEIGEQLSSLVLAKVSAQIREQLHRPAKITFTETEAAEFLGVGKATLQLWRNNKLINYTLYPLARRSDTNTTGLSSLYSYSLDDLLDFRERYRVRNLPAKFAIKKDISPTGAEIVKIGRKQEA